MSICWGDDGDRSKPEGVVITMPDHPRWAESECIDIFYRLLIMGWLQPSRMSVEMARDYGERLGHYGIRALRERGDYD